MLGSMASTFTISHFGDTRTDSTFLFFSLVKPVAFKTLDEMFHTLGMS